MRGPKQRSCLICVCRTGMASSGICVYQYNNVRINLYGRLAASHVLDMRPALLDKEQVESFFEKSLDGRVFFSGNDA